MIVRVNKYAVKRQGTVPLSVIFYVRFQRRCLVAVFYLAEVVGTKSVFSACIEISIQPAVGFSRERGVKADICRMAATKFHQHIDGGDCSSKIVLSGES